MSDLNKFTLATTDIFSRYGDSDLGYSQAEFLISEEVHKLLAAHLFDTPDRILEAVFEAFADLQVQAYEQQDISQSEASNAISQRAEDLFDKSRPPEDIEALWQTYETILYREDEEQPKNRLKGFFKTDTNPDEDFPDSFGGFSLN